MTGPRSRNRRLYLASLMTALAFVIPGQGVAEEQNPQPRTHAVRTAGAFSRTLTAALRQFEQAATTRPTRPGPEVIGGAARVIRNALSDAENALAEQVVGFRGGTFVGQTKPNTPGVDGFLDGVPAQLKTTGSQSPTAVLAAAREAKLRFS